MPLVTITEPFSVELSGAAHPPYEKLELDLCALLLRGGTELSAFTGTAQGCPSVVAGVRAEARRQGAYSILRINMAAIDSTYSRLVIAAHVERTEGPLRTNTCESVVDPTIRSLTYSARGGLSFGYSQSFTAKDVVHGAKLLDIERTERGWVLNDDLRPASYPELVEFAAKHDLNLASFKA